MRCWPWFAGCVVFAWALRLRLPAAEAACGSAERESGVACVTTGWQGGAPAPDRCPRELPRVTTTSQGKKILLDSSYRLDNQNCR
jgi:hypothetical protein